MMGTPWEQVRALYPVDEAAVAAERAEMERDIDEYRAAHPGECWSCGAEPATEQAGGRYCDGCAVEVWRFDGVTGTVSSVRMTSRRGMPE